MGFLKPEELSVLSASTPVCFMSKNYDPGSYRYLQKWPSLTKDNTELQWPL